MDDQFSGTWALVTGASSGLGEEFARQLAARKTNLVLTARSEGALSSLAAQLVKEHGIRAEVIALDLGTPGGAEHLCREVDARGHQIAHLVSNAGFGLNGPVVDANGPRLADMVRLNCEALVVLSHHFLPRLVEKRAGGIIHVASIAGYQPVPYMAVYGATKAFVVSFSVALAEEARASGVRVLALCPGPVATGFQAVAGSGIAPSQKAAVLDAKAVVARGILAYERGKTVCVPGTINRVQLMASKIAPQSLVVKSVARMMKTKSKSKHGG